MKSVRDVCKLRREVLEGDLEDAIFAADFGHVIDGIAPKVYKDPSEFIRNTHPAKPLQKLVTTIFGRLADANEAGAAIRLSTGFGGGKTHTLIALWHLANNISKSTLGTELLPAAGRPAKVKVAGIDASQFGSLVCGSHKDLETHSLWGELAYQLGKKTGYAKMKKRDKPSTSPNAAELRAILPKEPVLILLDELVVYMAMLGDQERKTLLSFLNLLIGEIVARKQAAVVITDPSGQASYGRETRELEEELAKTLAKIEAARHLDEVLGRKTTDFNPIGNEAAQVISRRLFEKIQNGVPGTVSAEYHNAYKRIAEEHPDALPPEALTLEYAKRIEQCYPFHPRLLESAQDRLGAMQDFQKSRGTLRLFARILRDVWDGKKDISLITAGDLDWTSERIQADLLQRLNRDNFVPAVNADIVRHAGQLDDNFSTDIHRRVASAVLLESLPANPNAAMDKRDIALAILRPADVGHEPGEAIDRLLGICWHTYKDDTGRKYQFRFEPNVNKLIEERSQHVSPEDAKSAVLTLVQNYFRGVTFELAAYPPSPRAIPDSGRLKLVLSDSEQLAKEICEFEDNSEPQNQRPRRFRNAIFGITPTPADLDVATQEMRRLMAAREIAKEYKQKGALKEQVNELLPAFEKWARMRALRAFNRVVFQGRPSVSLEEKYLVSDDSALQAGNGQAKLKDFLDEKKMVYQHNDALDVDLLLESIMKGATPSLDHPGAFPASAIHERALSHEKLRLMMNDNPVRNAILKGVEQGRLAVRYPNGEAYDNRGCVVGLTGARRRIESKRLTTLRLESDILMAPMDAPCVKAWTKVDAQQRDELTIVQAALTKATTEQVIHTAIKQGHLDTTEKNGEVLVLNNDRFRAWQPPYDPGVIFASSWDEAIAYATKRPLKSVMLKTRAPNTAKTLVSLGQPFGAKSLKLNVQVGGELKDGGQVSFGANDLKHNNPLKPIDIAAMLQRAMTSGSQQFEAELQLAFGEEGLKDSGSRFTQARDMASDEVELKAEFGKEEK